jgi:putative transposase
MERQRFVQYMKRCKSYRHYSRCFVTKLSCYSRIQFSLYLYTICCISFMCSLYRNKYRIESARYRNYDYTSPGEYFITICTKNQTRYFGEILDGQMILSETGRIVYDCWMAIPTHFSHILLDEFIIMPDHLHGIIIINTKSKSASSSVQTPYMGVSIESTMDTGSPETPKLGVSTELSSKKGNKYWKSNSIGSIINQFKRICTITAKTNGFDLIWQSRYHDRIIRSRRELNRIRKYIRNNPANWHKI